VISWNPIPIHPQVGLFVIVIFFLFSYLVPSYRFPEELVFPHLPPRSCITHVR